MSDNCPICGRPADKTMTEHHLVPRCKKGKETVTLHAVCHGYIHATFTDTELAQNYDTIEKLIADERVKKFGRWCSKRPMNFKDSSTLSNRTNKNKKK